LHHGTGEPILHRDEPVRESWDRIDELGRQDNVALVEEPYRGRFEHPGFRGCDSVNPIAFRRAEGTSRYRLGEFFLRKCAKSGMGLQLVLRLLCPWSA